MGNKSIENLRELLEASGREYSGRSAFLLRDEEGDMKTVTYATLKKQSEYMGTSLMYDLSLQNKKIGLIGENSYEWCLSYLSITSIGSVVVPVDKEITVEELENIISFAQLEAIICDRKASSKVLAARQFINSSLTVICTEPTENNDKTIAFSELLCKGEAHIKKGDRDYFTVRIDKDKTAALLFTSGTTGTPKGVMLSHYNLCSDLTGVYERVRVEKDDVSLSVLPLHHTYEAIAFLMVIFSGAAISFNKSIRTLKNDFDFFRPTVFVTVPLMLEKLHRKIISEMERKKKRKKVQMLSVISSAINEEKKKKIFADIHSFFGGRLKKIIVGAAAIHAEVAEDFSLFGIPVIIGYGLTECSPIVICNSTDSLTFDSIGKPLSSVEVKLEDRDEKGIGEICVKGPMVMKGYYKNQVETDRVIIDEYLHTGDLGYRDKNGNYHITGRKKNVIVTANGKNIYPEEIEYFLVKNAVIKDAMIYAENDAIISAQILPDEEEIKRKLRKDSVSAEETEKIITEAVRATNRKLPSYKNIKRVKIRDKDFIRTSSHKIKRDKEENKS